MLVTLKEILKKAERGGYAVGAFNVNNLEAIQAVCAAAEAERSPVIISTSEGAIAYAGMDELGCLVHLAAKKQKQPIVFHLDHGKDEKLIEEAIKSGWYTSVMFDGSIHPFEENVRRTKRLVDLAHEHGVSLEAELGAIAGIEDFVSVEERDAHLTNPKQAAAFAKATGCDALAIAIGTRHGAFKFKGASHLDFPRLRQIRETAKRPLVLHGASGVPQAVKKLGEKFGAQLGEAKGVSDVTIRKAVSLGIRKINVDTDLRLAFDAGLRKSLHDQPKEIDPRKILQPATDLMTEVVRQKMRLFGSSGQAR